jgi:hypothetical protein
VVPPSEPHESRAYPRTGGSPKRRLSGQKGKLSLDALQLAL